MMLVALAVVQIISGEPSGCSWPPAPGEVACIAYCQDDQTGKTWPMHKGTGTPRVGEWTCDVRRKPRAHPGAHLPSVDAQKP